MSRLNELLHQAGSIGRNGDGSITRVGFSREYFQALELLKEKMEGAGDAHGNGPGGESPRHPAGNDLKAGIIAIGSHLDTVIRGGLYDGMLGVAGAIEAAARLREEGAGSVIPWKSGGSIWKNPVFSGGPLEAAV